jgi:hypothetical protein
VGDAERRLERRRYGSPRGGDRLARHVDPFGQVRRVLAMPSNRQEGRIWLAIGRFATSDLAGT